ncbi:eukaryotic translation initiation factor 4 gamma 1 isoform X1 [Paramuricea clavata]|uniref:Eukaryotic translation initiation factor 4 gamma 1 isoform X1 n=1 Tax=Paramuricea clavata TaxID=317549 RepID=A0A7D9J370_PARCT|nr:eukaryotic translation initiation factor 4 gamma 1 isoform X1 [Paramuricea clavata]
MHDCIFKLLRAGDEESLESMCKLLFTIGKDLDSDRAKPRIEQYFDQINRIIAAKKVSSRVIFMLRDVIELRQNKWVPRREEQYNPPITEMKKMREQRLTTQQQVKNNKQKKGGPGGQDSSKPISNDDVITNSKGEKSVPTEQQLRNKPSYPVQTVMMPGQRQGAYLAGHPMSVAPRSMRPARAIYSSSPQGHSPMQGYIQQQNFQYQVVGQDPYGQPVMRPTFIPNVQPAYQMQATRAPFQPQYHPQQHQYYNQGMPTIQTINLTKPKPKRVSKIIIRDADNKDITEQILSHTITATGRSESTPPLTNSTAQTEFSTIQAQFAAQVAARVGGEKGKQDNEMKAGETDKDKELQARTDHEMKTEINKPGNGSIATDEIHAKDVPPNNMETLHKVNSSAVENRTESPKNTTDNTHLNQGSPTLQEMTEKLRKTIEVQKEPQNEPKVLLLRPDREATVENGARGMSKYEEVNETNAEDMKDAWDDW